MKKFTLLGIIVLFLGIFNTSNADWKADLDSMISSPDEKGQERYLKRVVSANPDYSEVIESIRQMEFPEAPKGLFITRTSVCKDGVERPWVLYVPPEYDRTKPTPLMVILHGLVSRSQLIQDPEGYASQSEFVTKIAQKKGWLALLPLGQAGATWWDDMGMSNIKTLVRVVKREYNIDDNRVYLGGFSDGASGAYGFEMLDPTDYAAFFALNGDMGVPSMDGGLQTYAANFINTPIYASFTEDDPLYPARQMYPSVKLAIDLDGMIVYNSVPGKHSIDAYTDADFEKIIRFLDIYPRGPVRPYIVWETADPKFGRFQMFKIDKITDEPPADWYVDHNVEMTDSHISIGFVPDGTYEGEGTKVDAVVDGSLAQSCGLQPGDIIVKGNEMEIKNYDDLESFKSQLRRGGQAVLTINRNGERLVVKGNLPEPEKYMLFKHEKPSAMAKVANEGNSVNIEASRLGAFTLYILPEMFDLGKNIVINVDGKRVFNGKVEPDLVFMLQNFLNNRDRQLLYVAQVNVEL